MDTFTGDRSDGLLSSVFPLLAGLALDAAHDEIIWVDAGGRLIYANGSACAALQYPGAELLSLTLADICPGFASAAWEKHWQELKAAGHLVLEVTQRSRSGKCRVWELSITYLQHEGNEFASIIGRDVDDRLALEHELTEDKLLLESIFDNMQAGVLVLNPQGSITFANIRMARMFGFLHEDLIGSSYAHHVHPAERQESTESMRRLVNGEVEHVHHQRRYLCWNGSDFLAHFSCRRREDIQGNLISLVGVISRVS